MPERIVIVGREEDADELDRMYYTEDLTRCRDCMFYESGENEVDSWRMCTRHASNVEPDGYCAWAASRE